MDCPDKNHRGRLPMTQVTLILISMIGLATSIPSQAAYIDGRDWRQPLDTVGFSWEDTARVCDVVTGACTGIVENSGGETADLRGWTWASTEDVIALFRSLTGDPTADFSGPTPYKNPDGPAWIFDAMDNDGTGPDAGLFFSTNVSSELESVFGLSRTSILNSAGEARASREWFRYDISLNEGYAGINNPVAFDAGRRINGLWLFREVPEPPVYGLILLALGILLLQNQRKQRAVKLT